LDLRSDDKEEKKVRIGKEKIKIPCPTAVANYMHNTHGWIKVTSCMNIIMLADHPKKWWKFFILY
jgi:hypothetical protein